MSQNCGFLSFQLSIEGEAFRRTTRMVQTLGYHCAELYLVDVLGYKVRDTHSCADRMTHCTKWSNVSACSKN